MRKYYSTMVLIGLAAGWIMFIYALPLGEVREADWTGFRFTSANSSPGSSQIATISMAGQDVSR